MADFVHRRANPYASALLAARTFCGIAMSANPVATSSVQRLVTCPACRQMSRALRDAAKARLAEIEAKSQ